MKVPFYKYDLYRKYQTSDGVTYTPLDEYQSVVVDKTINEDCGDFNYAILDYNFSPDSYLDQLTLSNGGNCISEMINIDDYNVRTTLYDTGIWYAYPNQTDDDYYAFQKSGATDFSNLFYGCKLYNADLNKWDMSKVTNISAMFKYTPLNECKINEWNTSSITDMSSLFSECGSGLTIDLSSWDTSNVTNMSDLFNNTHTNYPYIETWDLSNVANMNNMYRYTDITSIDISNKDISKLVDASNIFMYCRKLKSLKITDSNLSSLSAITNSLEDVELDEFDISGSDFSNLNERINIHVDNSINISNTKFGEGFPKFDGYCTTINAENADVSKVKDFSSAFSLAKLSSINLKNFNSASATSFRQMFSNCVNLTNVEFDGIITSNVTDMYQMFANCKRLKEIDLSSFDITNLKNVNYLFNGCDSLTTVNLSNWDWRNITNRSFVFTAYQTSVTNYIAKNSKANGELVYYPSSSVQYLDISDSITYGEVSFDNNLTQRKLKEVNMSNYTFQDATNISNLFKNQSGLIKVDLSNLKMPNVTNISGMFYYCTSLTSLDLSNFYISNVTNISEMFYNCTSLTSLDLSSFDTSNVTDISRMFYYCTSLTSLDLSSFDVSNVKDISKMFYACNNLSHIKCTQSFKDWCIKNQSVIVLPSQMREGGTGTWEIVD